MKYLLVILVVVSACSAAPAPVPAPAPGPKPDPSLLYATPILAAPAAVSYSSFYKAPPSYSSYSVYTPYVYNIGYASGYPYSTYPYYII